MSHAMDYIIESIEEVLQTFQWAFPDRSTNRGEISVDRDSNEIVLEVWCLDNDDPDADEIKPLIVRKPLSDEDPHLQIRDIIHDYLCHEADEQMWFGNERLFYPHA